MKYILKKLEVKADDWKVVDVAAPDGVITYKASVNRKSKKGELFPNFDNLAEGMEIEAEGWLSPSGKWYLFPPRPAMNPNGTYAPRGGNMAKMMDKKQENIKESQENKEWGIKVSSTMRDAVLIVTSNPPHTPDEVQKEILFWRAWLWQHWDDPEKDTNYGVPF